MSISKLTLAIALSALFSNFIPQTSLASPQPSCEGTRTSLANMRPLIEESNNRVATFCKIENLATLKKECDHATLQLNARKLTIYRLKEDIEFLCKRQQ
jgi:hypothetical protein